MRPISPTNEAPNTKGVFGRPLLPRGKIIGDMGLDFYRIQNSRTECKGPPNRQNVIDTILDTINIIYCCIYIVGYGFTVPKAFL